MRTTLNISEEALKKVIALTNAKTKSEAVNKALCDFIRGKCLEKLINLRGKVRLEANWEKLRELEKNE